MQHHALPAPRPRLLVSLSMQIRYIQRQRQKQFGGEKDEATNGHGMESRGFEEAGGIE